MLESFNPSALMDVWMIFGIVLGTSGAASIVARLLMHDDSD